MVMDVNQMYYGDHFVIYANIELLSHTLEANIMLYINYTLIKKSCRKVCKFFEVMYLHKNMYKYVCVYHIFPL